MSEVGDRRELVASHESFGSEDAAEGLADRFASLTRALLRVDSLAEALQRVVVAARETVPPPDVISVTLRGPDGRFPRATRARSSRPDSGSRGRRRGVAGPVVAVRFRRALGQDDGVDHRPPPAGRPGHPQQAGQARVGLLAEAFLPLSRTSRK